MEKDINFRFRQFVEYINVQPTRLANDIGIHYESVNRLFRKEYENVAPSTKILAGLKRRYPELDMCWLFTGEGNMLLKGDNSVPKTMNLDSNKIIELLNTQIATQRDIQAEQVKLMAQKDEIINRLTEIIKHLEEKIK